MNWCFWQAARVQRARDVVADAKEELLSGEEVLRDCTSVLEKEEAFLSFLLEKEEVDPTGKSS